MISLLDLRTFIRCEKNLIKTKMDPLNIRKREELEKIIGHRICPLAAEETALIEMGVYVNSEMPLTVYLCEIDRGSARGGVQSELVQSRALTPCSEEYAGECHLYREFGTTTVNFHSTPEMPSCSIELNSGTKYEIVERRQIRGPGFGMNSSHRYNTKHAGTFIKAVGDVLYFTPNLRINKFDIETIT